MKKLLSFILCMILVIGCLSVSALAAGTGALSVTAGAAEVNVGDTVNFSVSLDPNGVSGGVKAFSFDLVIPAGLEFVSGSAAFDDAFVSATGAMLKMFNENNNRAALAGTTSAYTGNATTVLTFSCKVVAETDLTVSISNATLTDGSSSSVTPSLSGVTLTTPCKHVNTKVINAKEADCENDGYTGDTYCNDCQTTIKTGTVIPASKHEWDKGVVTTEPECEKAGVKTFTCGACGDTYTEEVEKTGHSYDKGVVTTEPECEKAGVKTFTCGACGDTYTEEVEKTGHSYDKGVVTTEPECEKAGVKTFTCGACGDTYTEEVEKTGHSYDNGVVTKEPTEEEEGVKTFTCGACGDTYTEPVAKLEGGETPPAGGEGEGGETPPAGGEGEGGETPPAGGEGEGGETPPAGGEGEGGETPPAGGEGEGGETPPADDDGETGGTTQDPTGTPNTGENSRLLVCAIAAGICLIGIAILSVKKKLLSK